MACSRTCAFLGGVFGVIVIALGASLSGVINGAIENGIKDGLVFKSDDIADFEKPDPSQAVNFCVFNYTNLAEAGTDATVKPAVDEICYTMMAHAERFNVSISEDGNKMQYNSRSFYVAVGAAMEMRLDTEMLTVPNAGFHIRYHAGRGQFIPGAIANMYAQAFNTTAAIEAQLGLDAVQAAGWMAAFTDGQTVVEFMEATTRGIDLSASFAAIGIANLAVQKAHATFMNTIGVAAMMATFPEVGGPFWTMPARFVIADPTYGFLGNSTNNDESYTYGEYSESYTGKDDINNVGKISKIDGESVYTRWTEDITLDGLHWGSSFSPLIGDSPPESYTIWSSDVKRPVKVVLADDHAVETNEIPMNRYVIDQELFTASAENVAQYQMFRGDGLMYMGPTTSVLVPGLPPNAPFWVSAPHMMHVDASVRDMTTGQAPDESLHGLFFDVEPYTGMVMNGHHRLQNNLRAENGMMGMVPGSELLYTTDDVFFPMFWADFYGGINEDDAAEFKGAVHDTVAAVGTTGPVLIVVGCLIAAISMIAAVKGGSGSGRGRAGLDGTGTAH